MIKSRPAPKAPQTTPTPPTEEELDEFQRIWAEAMGGQDEEVLRRTTRGVPDVDITYIQTEDC